MLIKKDHSSFLSNNQSSFISPVIVVKSVMVIIVENPNDVKYQAII